jgi:nucleoside-diphosphate-sugar epimerase
VGKSYWKGKKVLITGADGFIGSHLTEALLKSEASVSVLVRGTSISGSRQNPLKNLSAVRDDLQEIIAVNVASPDTISLVANAAPEVIFHLAADAYVPSSFTRPLEVTATNVYGTLNILHAAMKIESLERVVCTSSSEIYGTALTDFIEEKHPLNPTSPYGASKVAADRFAFAYYQTYGIPITIIRPFNTYGPRHTYDVIPKFIEYALKNEPLTIYGTGTQSRDFTYIDDMVNAFLLMGSHKDAIGKSVNFGTGADLSINAIAKLILGLSRSKSRIVYVGARQGEVQRLCCNPSLAKKLFGWQAIVSIEEGLRRNIKWAQNLC